MTLGDPVNICCNAYAERSREQIGCRERSPEATILRWKIGFDYRAGRFVHDLASTNGR